MGNNEETTTTEKPAIEASAQLTTDFAVKAEPVGDQQKQPAEHPECVNRKFWAQHGYE